MGIGILLDDTTFIIAFLKGLGVLESNPIYLVFGFPIFLIILILSYTFAGFVWMWIIKTYRKLYAKKGRYFKIYDIFVFITCVWIIFFATTKIENGFNNMQLLAKYYNPETRNSVMEITDNMSQYKANSTIDFNNKMASWYFDGISYDISYLKLWLCIIFGYLLFRTGFKVSPYDED